MVLLNIYFGFGAPQKILPWYSLPYMGSENTKPGSILFPDATSELILACAGQPFAWKDF